MGNYRYKNVTLQLKKMAVRIRNEYPTGNSTRSTSCPVINCEPTINSVTFNWNAVPGADSYDVIINGGAPVNQTNTSFSVTGLAPNDIVTITVIAIGTTACGPSMSSSDCQAQNCPQITLDIDLVMDICRDANTTPINLGYQIAGDDGSGTFTREAWS
ncbi:MAG: hypothetical protein R2769_08030 [Saprospiraceae bacterium]